MKLWKRAKGQNLGNILISWTYKASSRFFTKILTWILGAFVFGIFASIALHTIGLTDLSLSAARLVFFIVLVLGIIDAYFRNVVNGNEFQITENGLVHVKPFCGYDDIADKLRATNMAYFNKDEFISWEKITKVKESTEGLKFLLGNSEEELTAEIAAAIGVKNYNEDGIAIEKKANVAKYSFYSKDESFDRELKKAIAQKTRIAIDAFHNK
jgi:hypothetical protein